VPRANDIACFVWSVDDIACFVGRVLRPLVAPITCFLGFYSEMPGDLVYIVCCVYIVYIVCRVYIVYIVCCVGTVNDIVGSAGGPERKRPLLSSSCLNPKP
jgi:hypothetical protein